MESKEFKALFGDIAKTHGFKPAHGGWYKELPIALLVLSLQKSNFGNYFELNIKLFFSQAQLDDQAVLKKQIKSLPGDIFRRQPAEDLNAFDLDSEIGVEKRRELLGKLFAGLIGRIASAAGSPTGILRLRDEGVIFLLPMIEARLVASSTM